MGMPFLFQPPDFLCKDKGLDDVYHHCDENEACNSNDFLIDEDSSFSIAVSFHLYCGRKYLIGACGSIFFIGAGIAGFNIP